MIIVPKKNDQSSKALKFATCERGWKYDIVSVNLNKDISFHLSCWIVLLIKSTIIVDWDSEVWMWESKIEFGGAAVRVKLK